MSEPFIRAVSAIAVAAILLAVLPPQPAWFGTGPSFIAGIIPTSVSACLDVLQNICLYVPLGLAIAARGRSRTGALLVGAAFSIATELVQLAVPGRHPNAADVAANTAGAWVGAALFSSARTAAVRRWLSAADRHLGNVLDPEQRHAAPLSLAWAAVVAATLTASVWLLVPAPLEPPYRIASAGIDHRGGPIRIGANGAPDGYFSGLIDEVRIFNGARPEASIAADMRTPAARGGAQGEDLIAAYSFDSPGDVVRDSSGRGHHATQAATTWTNVGRFGGAMSFGGAGEVLVPLSPGKELDERWTVEAWIFPVGDPAPESTVIAAAGSSFFLLASTEQGRFEPAGGGMFGGESEDVRPPTRIEPGTWTHVALTYDGEALRFYINGALASMHVRWAPHRLLNASMNDVPLHSGLLPDGAAVSEALRHGGRFRATIACNPPARAVAPVFLIEARWDIKVFTVSVAGDDLLMSAATWPSRWRLPSPPYRAEAALRDCSPGRELALEVSGPLQNPRVRVGGRAIQGNSPGIASGWTFLLHSELFPEPVGTGAGLAWLAFLLVPFGYLARPTGWTLGGAVLVGVAAWIMPGLWQVPPPSVSQALALFAGSGLGVLLRKQARRRDATSRAGAPRSE